MAKEDLFNSYKTNMEEIQQKVNSKLLKKKTIILKNIGHSLVSERTVHAYDYIGQIYELTEYLKKMEHEAEHLFNFYSLAVTSEGESNVEVGKIRDVVVGKIQKELNNLVKLKRSITMLERSC